MIKKNIYILSFCALLITHPMEAQGWWNSIKKWVQSNQTTAAITLTATATILSGLIYNGYKRFIGKYDQGPNPSLRIIKKLLIENESMLVIAQGEIQKNIKNIPYLHTFKKNGHMRTIVQYKSINQGALSKEKFRPVGDNCPWIALFNCRNLFEFYKTNNKISTLEDGLNEDELLKFYNKVKKLMPKPEKGDNESIENRIANMDEITLGKLIQQFIQEKEAFAEHISILDNIIEFDFKYHKLDQNWWKNTNSLFHAFIVQTTDEIKDNKGGYRSHWYVIAIFKKDKMIQYIVMDSILEAHLTKKISYIDTGAYPTTEHHLTGNSYNLNRLLYLIDLFEDGKSDKDLYQLRKNSLPEDLKESTKN
jgi:hypothetical protein